MERVLLLVRRPSIALATAILRFEGAPAEHVLRAGDHLVIPAHRRHRMEWTDAREPTVWLAVYYAGQCLIQRATP